MMNRNCSCKIYLFLSCFALISDTNLLHDWHLFTQITQNIDHQYHNSVSQENLELELVWITQILTINTITVSQENVCLQEHLLFSSMLNSIRHFGKVANQHLTLPILNTEYHLYLTCTIQYTGQNSTSQRTTVHMIVPSWGSLKAGDGPYFSGSAGLYC